MTDGVEFFLMGSFGGVAVQVFEYYRASIAKHGDVPVLYTRLNSGLPLYFETWSEGEFPGHCTRVIRSTVRWEP